MSRFVILAILYVVLATYGFQAFRTLFKSPLLHWTYIVLFLAALIFLTVKVIAYVPGDGFKGSAAVAGGIFAAFFLLALVLCFFLLLASMLRLF